jgi:MFS family permease
MHILGMYGLSIVTGWISDRWGRLPTIVIGSLMLILSCILAPTNPETLPLAASLFLLGLGWNFCYVGGSSLLADALLPSERSRAQGFNDLLIGLASASSSLSSGVVFSALGFGLMGVVGAVFSIALATMTAWWLLAKRRAAYFAG